MYPPGYWTIVLIRLLVLFVVGLIGYGLSLLLW